MTEQTKWYLGSLNDGLFISNQPPSPCGTDIPPDWGTPASVVLNVVALSQEHAQAIVDAHNAALDTHHAALLARLRDGERYQWLCQHSSAEPDNGRFYWDLSMYTDGNSFADLDAAIDAQIGGGEGGK